MSANALFLMLLAAPGQCAGGSCSIPTGGPIYYPQTVIQPWIPAQVQGNISFTSDGRPCTKVEDAEGSHYRVNNPVCPAGFTPGEWLITRDINNRPSWRKWEGGVELWYYPRSWSGVTLRTSAEFSAFVAERKPEEKMPGWAVKGVSVGELATSPTGQWIGSQPFAASSLDGKGLITPEDVKHSLRAAESRPEPQIPRQSGGLSWLAVAVIAAAIVAAFVKLREA